MDDFAEKLGVKLTPIADRTLVTLKVSKKAAAAAAERLSLAGPLQQTGSDPASVWIGPDFWILTSKTLTAGEIVSSCSNALSGLTYQALDYSDGMFGLTLSGPRVRDVLAAGTGLDLRNSSFQPGMCQRTRFADIAAIICSLSVHDFEVFVDRSFSRHLQSWLADKIATMSMET